MKGLISSLAVMVLCASLFSGPLNAQDAELIERDFSGIEAVNLRTLIGGCRIMESEDGDIHVTVMHKCFEAEYQAGFDVQEGKLNIDERISWDGEDLAGRSAWLIRVPAGTAVSFNSIMGSVLATDLSFDMEIGTITGEVGMMRCSGDFNILSGTGEINVLDCNGTFVLRSGTGNISIAGSEGSFEAASEEGQILIEGVEATPVKSYTSTIGGSSRRFAPFESDEVSMSTETGKAVVN